MFGNLINEIIPYIFYPDHTQFLVVFCCSNYRHYCFETGNSFDSRQSIIVQFAIISNIEHRKSNIREIPVPVYNYVFVELLMIIEYKCHTYTTGRRESIGIRRACVLYGCLKHSVGVGGTTGWTSSKGLSGLRDNARNGVNRLSL